MPDLDARQIARFPEHSRKLLDLLKQRIVILDGGMGSVLSHAQVEGRGLSAAHTSRIITHDLTNCNELLVITRPELIYGVHKAYFDVGADIVETNSFNSQSVLARKTRAGKSTFTIRTLEAVKVARRRGA